MNVMSANVTMYEIYILILYHHTLQVAIKNASAVFMPVAG